jgi:hypothetical protein
MRAHTRRPATRPDTKRTDSTPAGIHPQRPSLHRSDRSRRPDRVQRPLSTLRRQRTAKRDSELAADRRQHKPHRHTRRPSAQLDASSHTAQQLYRPTRVIHRRRSAAAPLPETAAERASDESLPLSTTPASSTAGTPHRFSRPPPPRRQHPRRGQRYHRREARQHHRAAPRGGAVIADQQGVDDREPVHPKGRGVQLTPHPIADGAPEAGREPYCSPT